MTRLEWYEFKGILSVVLPITCGIALIITVIYKCGYKDGQVDCIQGKIKYEETQTVINGRVYVKYEEIK